ncbi:MAG: nitrous oxide reductase family maturation protein NosD [Chitinophagaceae bacterium]|nr:nitrous oxide reductase family maturation protein NosD [Chitinophagaceae bacterium]
MRLLFITILSILFLRSEARIIMAGPTAEIKELRKALALARDGDSILLQAGIYKEGSLLIERSISLIGTNAILDGEKKYQVLLVSGKNILISGLTIRNAGYSAMEDFAAVKVVDASNVTIENCHIINAYFAIHISNTRAVVIRNNRIEGTPRSEQLSGNGIHLWKSNFALIENNHVTGHRDGIYFEFVTSSTIRRNHSEKNIRYGLHFMFSNDDAYIQNIFNDNGAGVAVMYSKKVRMEANRFDLNWGASAYGLLLKDITDSYIARNIFYKNTVALHMEGTSRIEIRNNDFRNNGWAIKVQASCDNNRFWRNNFTGNSFDVATNGSVSLNQFSQNYWDKYEGYDLNHDGVGDIPFRPVSMYSMIIEENPNALLLMRSFTVQLLDKAEKALPVITPGNLTDDKPMMKYIKQ